MKNLKRIGMILLALIILCIAAFGIYAADYYHMDETAVTYLEGSDTVSVTVEDGLAVFMPDDPQIGLIFYPGGKVEYTAYAPLMEMLAENGILCAVPHMPLNLAVMDMDIAETVSAKFPEIGTWYIGGHSLGGSMAAAHAEHCNIVKGVILLAAYSTADLSHSDLRVLSIYGSRDGVLNMEAYKENLSNLPADTTEILLEGGNHAQFGSYGKQEGDGDALIGEFEQQVRTMQQILYFTGLSEPEIPEYETEEYTYWIERDGKAALRSTLTLTPEVHTFYLSVSLLSSRIIYGTYTMENDVLTCTTMDDGSVYTFEVTDSGMVYRAAESDDIYAHTSALDSASDFTEAPVPDGAVYGQLMICS